MFAKVFNKILDSSISEDWFTRHVFMDLLLLSDQDGIVDITLNAILRRTNAPNLEMLKLAIKKLESPDEASRTETDDGRRIELIDDHRDWGWRIINYEKYRYLRNADDVRAGNRDRKRKQRNPELFGPDGSLKSNLSFKSRPVTQVEVDTEVEVEVDTEPLISSYSPPSSPTTKSALKPSDLMDLWNEHRGALPKAQRLSKVRQRLARALLAVRPDITAEDWANSVKRLASSKWVVEVWRPTLDKLLSEDTYLKNEEGTYDERKRTGAGNSFLGPRTPSRFANVKIRKESDDGLRKHPGAIEVGAGKSVGVGVGADLRPSGDGEKLRSNPDAGKQDR